MQTWFNGAFRHELEAERRSVQETQSTSLIRRMIAPEEFEDLVAFVCSPKAAAINGAALRADDAIGRCVS